jgi:hydroxymethylglutaryl-CoA lyase
MRNSGLVRKIEIIDVGPRDGLQNEPVAVDVATKVEMIERLIGAGLRRLEVASFVNERRVPQMADAEAVVARLPKRAEVTCIGLVLNERGASRAVHSGIDELGTLAVASDSFGRRNQNQSIEESIESCLRIMRFALEHGRSTQASIAMAFGCPFEGRIRPDKVVEIAERLAAGGPREIGLADTIGVAVPDEVAALVSRVQRAVHPLPIRVHFHNTRNTAIANVWAAIEEGAAAIDSSVGGIGGCPFAPGAAGNVATEDVVYLLDRSYVESGVQLDRIIDTAKWCRGWLGRDLPGMVSRAGGFPP